MKPGFLLALIAGACLATTLRADVLKIGCSDWPGSAALEIASEKGWFKEAGLEVEIVRAEYPSSIAAFAGTATDAVCIVGSDALVAGANGTKCRIIAAFDYSDGGDAIVGAPGVESIKDLKGRKVGVEVGFVGHLLLLQALRSSGMKQSDVELTIIPAKEAAQALTGGNVAAAALRQPALGQVLKQVAGSKALFTSADSKGLIYDVLAVNPESYRTRKGDWAKFVGACYRAIAYLKDPKTAADAISIAAAKSGGDASFAEAIAGTHFLSLGEAKKAFRNALGVSLAAANKLNLEAKLYKTPQKPEAYLASSIVENLK